MRRGVYAGTLLKTGSVRKASKASGLKDKRNLRNIAERLLADPHTLDDRPRSGRPRKYTDDILKAAYELVATEQDALWTTAELMQRLCDDGKLSSSGDPATFRERLKEYTRRQGHVLVTNSNGTIFLITQANAKQRVSWCRAMIKLCETLPLDKWWIEDETEMSERPHHRGTKPVQCAILNTQETTRQLINCTQCLDSCTGHTLWMMHTYLAGSCESLCMPWRCLM
jgi:hypothetical protein